MSAQHRTPGPRTVLDLPDAAVITIAVLAILGGLLLIVVWFVTPTSDDRMTVGLTWAWASTQVALLHRFGRRTRG